MKSSSVKVGVILIGLIMFGYAEVWGADWKTFDVNQDFTISYDTLNITRISKSIIRVPTKVIFTEKGASDVVRILGKRLENLSYSLNLTELDCEGKLARSLVQTYYTKGGEVIESLDTIKSRTEARVPWIPIEHESTFEVLYKAVCK
jgi:hypothetical protein